MEIISALGTRRLRLYGHVCSYSDTSSIKSATKFAVPGSGGQGGPRKTWNECVEKYIIKRGLSVSDPEARLVCRAAVNASRLLEQP